MSPLFRRYRNGFRISFQPLAGSPGTVSGMFVMPGMSSELLGISYLSTKKLGDMGTRLYLRYQALESLERDVGFRIPDESEAGDE